MATNSQKGFYILDISDLNNIQTLNIFTNIEGDIDHIEQFKRREQSKIILLLGAGFKGIYTVELANDFSEIKILDNFLTEESVEAISLNQSETIAYVGIRKYGFQIFDISDFFNIKLLYDIKLETCEVK